MCFLVSFLKKSLEGRDNRRVKDCPIGGFWINYLEVRRFSNPKLTVAQRRSYNDIKIYKLFNTIIFSCTLLKENFLFNDEPLSEEERLYPLAYGLVVYKSAFQVYMMMSAIYHVRILF